MRPGTGKGPRLLVAAHLDTVFAEGTDVKVREKDGKLYAPGIADDSRGLAALLGLVRAFNASGIKTKGDIVFCGNVGEEGLGDLRGVKLFSVIIRISKGSSRLTACTPKRLRFLATGSHRYEITYKGPGGHSYRAFGLPSATHALGRAIAKIAELKTPERPQDNLYGWNGLRRDIGEFDCRRGDDADGYAFRRVRKNFSRWKPNSWKLSKKRRRKRMPAGEVIRCRCRLNW